MISNDVHENFLNIDELYLVILKFGSVWGAGAGDVCAAVALHAPGDAVDECHGH